MGMTCQLISLPGRETDILLADPAAIYELLEDLDGSPSVLSLETSWHGLHFVLTGTAEEGDPPNNFLVAGGEPVGDEDMGYGPARVFDPDLVLELDTVLGSISDEEFALRFDPRRMAVVGIYPQIWDEDRQELFAVYARCFRELKAYVHRTVQTGQTLIVVIS